MISLKHRTVFVHVPKAAGQSVEQAFLDDLGLDWKSRAPLLLRANDDPAKGPPRLAHLTAAEYVALGYITAEDWRAFYTFGIVRNPFSRTVSLYRHLGPDMTFADWVNTWLTKTLAAQPGTRARWFVRYQVEFLCDAEGIVLVDDLLRFEALAAEFTRVAQAAGLRSARLPRRNATGRRPQPDIDRKPSAFERFGRKARALLVPSRLQWFTDWRDYYDAQTMTQVAQLYDRDFETFGYDGRL